MLCNNLNDFFAKYCEAMSLMLERGGAMNLQKCSAYPSFDNLRDSCLSAMTALISDPSKFMQLNMEYTQKLLQFQMDFISGNINNIRNTSNDRRFKSSAWDDSVYFSFLKNFYIFSSDWYKNIIVNLDVPDDQRKFLKFYSEQVINAASPSNYLHLNPDVINEIVKSNGANLVNGLVNFIDDLKKSEKSFEISKVDNSAFEIGVNIAKTKGKVIYQNELMQLICYEPKEKTFTVPIFIVPAWINKYYVLDLSERNSFVKYLVDNNFQVFIVSWVNPDNSLSAKNFEDYLYNGIIEPLNFLQKSFKISEVNAIGYCLGGTLLSCALAYLKSKNSNPIKSATFLTTMLDFAESGELGIFINENLLESFHDEVMRSGCFDGRHMSAIFSMLRANDLIWSFVVNNYLLGKKPTAFDILYWNSDVTNLPAAMHLFYLENMYLQNNLIKKNGIKLLGSGIDLCSIDVPMFFLAAKDDNIVPWTSAYIGMQKIIGDRVSRSINRNINFCLAGGGHMAGVINPVASNKYSYWTMDTAPQQGVTASGWFDHAVEHKGSWWNYWKDWVSDVSGDVHDAIPYNAMQFIEEAPGSFVKRRLDQ